MHLLIIITDYGSFNNFLSELVIKVVSDNNKVSVICSKDKVINYNDKFDYTALGVDIYFVDFPRGFNIYKQLISSIKIYNLVKQLNPDLVHAHFTTGIFTTILYKKLPVTTIGTIHGLGFPVLTGVKKYIFKLIEYFCIERLDQVWLLNNFDYQIVKKINKNKAFILNSAGLGCDLDRFDYAKFKLHHDDIMNELHISINSFVIAFTGRFVHFKGFNLVVKAFLKLNKLYPSTYTLILIGGADPIHPTGLNCKEEEEYLNCKEIIKVGFTKNVEKYLSVCDAFVFPSLKEGMPICIVEALAMGVPTITANSRGCNDLVNDHENGILLSDKPTEDEVVKAIQYLKDNPLLLKQLRGNALMNRYVLSRNIYIDEQIAVYNNLIDA